MGTVNSIAWGRGKLLAAGGGVARRHAAVTQRYDRIDRWSTSGVWFAIPIAYTLALAPLAYRVLGGAFLVTSRSDQYKGAYTARGHPDRGPATTGVARRDRWN